MVQGAYVLVPVHIEYLHFSPYFLHFPCKNDSEFCLGNLLYLFLQFSDVFCIFLRGLFEELIQMEYFQFSHC